MITTVAEFIAENNKRKKLGLPSLNENFMDTDTLSNEEGVQETEMDNEFDNELENETEEAPVITIDTFKEALTAKFNENMENLEEGAEEPEMLTDLQMQLAFDAYQSISPAEEDVQDEEGFEDVQGEEGVQDEEGFEGVQDEIVEEGLFGTYKPTPEQKQAADARLAEIKSKWKNIVINKDGKQVPFTDELYYSALANNKYRGAFETFPTGDKVVLRYKEGLSLLQKIAVGTGDQVAAK